MTIYPYQVGRVIVAVLFVVAAVYAYHHPSWTTVLVAIGIGSIWFPVPKYVRRRKCQRLS